MKKACDSVFEGEARLKEKERLLLSRRLRSLYGIGLVLLSAIVLRLADLQIIHGSTWKARAMSVNQDEWSIPAPRGDIYDRSHKLLVTSQASFSVYFTPYGVKRQNLSGISRRLSVLLGISDTELMKKMDAIPPFHSPVSEPRCLYKGLTEKQIAYLTEHRHELPGVHIITEPKRQYVNGSLACHVLGYLNSIPVASVKQYQKLGYRSDARVGVSGVERSYESQLRGRDGRFRTILSQKQEWLSQETISRPEKGNSLVLSIDSRLQSILEDALASQVRSINSNPKLKNVQNAMAVAMNPQNGEVLALASYPAFDPNWWVSGIDEATYSTRFLPAGMNRALQQPVAPGSTIKPATVLLGLQQHVITPYTTFYDEGRLQVGWNQGKPHYLYCWDHNGHGEVTARKALAVSCNVYMYNLSLRLGRWSNYLTDSNSWINHRLPETAGLFNRFFRQFGLGQPTGIDLPEEPEEPGYMGHARVLADLPYIAIGQHEAYTAVELVQYVSVLANGGRRMEPHVAKEVRSADGHLLTEIKPRVLGTVNIAPSYLRLVRAGMRDVVEAPYGTAYSTFRGAPYSAAGKTGTAETGVSEDNALFVGFAPVERPEIAIAVIVPGGGHGSDSSVPIARKIFDGYFGLAPSAGKTG